MLNDWSYGASLSMLENSLRTVGRLFVIRRPRMFVGAIYFHIKITVSSGCCLYETRLVTG